MLQRAADFKKEAEIKIDVGKYPFHQRKYLVTAFEKLLGGQILHTARKIYLATKPSFTSLLQPDCVLNDFVFWMQVVLQQHGAAIDLKHHVIDPLCWLTGMMQKQDGQGK